MPEPCYSDKFKEGQQIWVHLPILGWVSGAIIVIDIDDTAMVRLDEACVPEVSQSLLTMWFKLSVIRTDDEHVSALLMT